MAELRQLDLQLVGVSADEARLTQTKQKLAVRIEEFWTRRGVLAARYTAAQAQVRATEGLTGISGEFAELSMALGRAVEKTDQMQARAAAVGGLLDAGSLDVFGEEPDPVERALFEATVDDAVEEDLAALRAGPDSGASPPALSRGRDDGADQQADEEV